MRVCDACAAGRETKGPGEILTPNAADTGKPCELCGVPVPHGQGKRIERRKIDKRPIEDRLKDLVRDANLSSDDRAEQAFEEQANAEIEADILRELAIAKEARALFEEVESACNSYEEVTSEINEWRDKMRELMK
jgi:hypothetical protein